MIRFIFILILPLTSFATGPIIVGNGGGESEFNLMLAQSQISFFWNLCQQDINCKSAADGSPGLRPALRFVETAQLYFHADDSGNEAAKVDQNSRRIDFNQKWLWNPDGRGFSLSESFNFYLILIEKNFATGSENFRRAFLPLVDSQLKEVNASVNETAKLKAINLQNGLITLMIESSQALLDIQSLNLSNQIQCPVTKEEISQLKLANLSYGYRVDHAKDSDFYFNSHVRFTCPSGSYKAHVIFSVRILNSVEKFDLDHQLFQINSIEKVD